MAALYSYPIKSMRGIRRETLDIADGRPDADRLWMLVDEHGRFMHQRDHPQMARVAIALFEDSVSASSAGLPSLSLARPD
ncbi:MAG: MOSC N-terminal beta barrel domain-containing protein, partial [Gemmatimonadales bacterium]